MRRQHRVETAATLSEYRYELTYIGSVNRNEYADQCASRCGAPWCQLRSGVYGGIARRTSEKEMRNTMTKGTKNNASSQSVGTPAISRRPIVCERRTAILLGEYHRARAVPGEGD